MGWRPRTVLLAVFLLVSSQAGCVLGPYILHNNQRGYNESVKCTDEEELLLNLVRLRYNDDIGLLNTNAITAQYEAQGQVSAVPFFSGGLTRILPAGFLFGACRPTFSLAPVMDGGVYRRLFRTIDNTDLIELAELSWPTATVFRLWFQYANGVPNAVSASGPTREFIPDYAQFQAGMGLLQMMKDRGWCAIAIEEQVTPLGSPLPANSVTPAALLDAVRNGYEYRKTADDTWVLVQVRKILVLRLSPESVGEPEVCEFREIFHLSPEVLAYPLKLVGPEPQSPKVLPHPPKLVGPERQSPEVLPYPQKLVGPEPQSGEMMFAQMAALQLVPRSPIEVYYYLAHGVDVPAKHLECGLAKATLGPDHEVFDWHQVTQDLFTVHHAHQICRPKNAHVAVKYCDHWFYIANDDAASKSTFALVLLLARVEFGLTASSPAKPGPVLTLPVGR